MTVTMECNYTHGITRDRERFQVKKFGFRSNYFLEVHCSYSSGFYLGSCWHFRVSDNFDLSDIREFDPVYKDPHHCEGFKYLTMITNDGITHKPIGDLPFPDSNYLFVNDFLDIAETVGMTIPELTRETLEPFIKQVKQKVVDNHEPLFEEIITELRDDFAASREKVAELEETIKKLESERATLKDEIIAKLKESISKI